MPPTQKAVVSRRTFVAMSGAALASTGASLASPEPAHAAFSANPFQLGSASGDPTSTSVILWTRLALDPTATDAGMSGQPASIAVAWAVYPSYAAAAAGTSAVRSGTTTALQSQHWSVHVEAGTQGTGSALTPGTRYWYRFSTAGTTTTHHTWVGTFRTCPATTADVDARFAVFSCQNYIDRNHGVTHFHGYDHLNDEIDIADPDANPTRMDFVVHLGDYIYEGGFSAAQSATGDATVPPAPCTSLTDYRRRWGWYLSRDSLQRSRRLYPSFVVLDDHELVNDINGAAVATNVTGNATSDAQLTRYNAALTAYWENQPLRGGPPAALAGQDKLRLPITRTIRWGKHLTLMLWDCRQFRTSHSATSPSILGSAQLSATLHLINTSAATWTVFGTTSPISSYVVPEVAPGGFTQGWLAFPAERETITNAIKARRSAGGFNAAFVAGDIHCALASTVRRTTDPRASADTVAVEFTGPPASSDGGDWSDIRSANSSALLRWIGYDPAAPTHPYKGYLRCSATADTFYANYVGGAGWLNPAGTVASKFRGKTPVGVVDVVPY